MRRSTLFLNIIFYIGLIILLFFLIYPHTRYAHQDTFVVVGSKGLNCTKKKLHVGESFSLYIKGTNKRAVYRTSDFKVASVTIAGNVRAHKKGMAIIYVYHNKTKYTCKIKVIN